MRRASFATMIACTLLVMGPAARADSGSEAAVAALFDDLLESPTSLRIFLQAMPKGGDLHNHLSGTPYAEDYLQWAAAAGYCANDDGDGVRPPPCPAEKSIKVMGEREPFAFARLVDALSTRGLQKGIGRDRVSGHTQFFSSFERFGAISDGRTAQSIATTRRIAAGDKVSYVELIYNPAALVQHVLAGPDAPLDETGLADLYAREISGIAPILEKARAELDGAEAAARAELRCGSAKADPGCAVAIHYLAWGWRDLPPAQAFRSLILAFAMAASDARFVGVNFVQPEDWVIALRDYDLHMAMFRFLGNKYPGVHRTMHAGELAFGAVPPAALRDHIGKALDAGAERIGHGAAIAYEDDAIAKLGRMARDRIAVEVNLTSNDVILGVKGADHPLALYRRFGVPLVLSTDDQGILRTDLTNEYVRAAAEQGLRYADLKELARASLEYAFLPGASLWKDGKLGAPVEPCARSRVDPSCRRFVRADEKAHLQAELEDRFDIFERERLESADRHRKTAAHRPSNWCINKPEQKILSYSVLNNTIP